MLSLSSTGKERWLYKIQQQKASCVVPTLEALPSTTAILYLAVILGCSDRENHYDSYYLWDCPVLPICLQWVVAIYSHMSHFAYACKTEGKNGISRLNFRTMRKLSDLYSGIFQTQSSGCASGVDYFRNFTKLKILNI